MSSKTFTQQRAILRPNKNAAFFADDDDDEDDDDDLYSLTDDGSSSITSISTNADTLVLAQFLASTGPEEFLKPSKKQQQNPQFRRASRLFNKLRKKGAHQGINTATILSAVSPTSTAAKGNLNGSINSLRSNHGQIKTHMPLPVYQPTPPVPSPISVGVPNVNSEIHAPAQPPNSNKNMAFLSHQPKPRQRHHHHNNQPEQPITPTNSTSSSSVTSHGAPQPSSSRSTSSSTSRRHLSLRDSGVYSDFSEKEDMIPPVPAPSLPVKSQFRSSQHHTQPKRPAPLPASVASAAIASATAGTNDEISSPPPIPPFNQRRAISSTSTSTDRRSVIRHSGAVPAAALKRRSVRIRHIQIQTDRSISKAEEDGEHVCSHCHQPLLNKNEGNNGRRTSCPSVLPNGQLIPKQPSVEESKQLLEMIEQLKAQLAQEQHSRIQLEQAMSRQQETAKKIDLVQREKDRWKGDCLWLNDRIALLPE